MDSTGDTSNLTPGAANRETMEQGLPGHPHQEQGQTHQHMPPPSFYQSLVPAAARAHHTSYGGSPIGNTSLMLNHGYPAMSFYQNPAHYPANQIINPGHPHVPYQSGHAGSLPASYLSHHTSFGGGQTSSITYPFTGYYAARPGYPEAQLSSTGHTTLSHVRSYHMPQSPQRVPVYGSHHDLKQGERLGKSNVGYGVNKRAASEEITSKVKPKRRAKTQIVCGANQNELLRLDPRIQGTREPTFRAKRQNSSVETDLKMRTEDDSGHSRTHLVPPLTIHSQPELNASHASRRNSEATHESVTNTSGGSIEDRHTHQMPSQTVHAQDDIDATQDDDAAQADTNTSNPTHESVSNALEVNTENRHANQMPPVMNFTQEDVEAAHILMSMSQATPKKVTDTPTAVDAGQPETSRRAPDSVVTRKEVDNFTAALTNALTVASSRPTASHSSPMPTSPRELAPPFNSPTSSPKISKTTGKAFSNQKTVRDTPRKRAPAKNFNYMEGLPIPNSWTEASDADKTLWQMKAAGKDWTTIRKVWSEMTGQSTALSTLPNRYKRLQAAFESLKEGDDLRVLQAKRDVDQEMEAEKWARVALAVEKRGGAKYAPEFVKREFDRLNAASGGHLGH